MKRCGHFPEGARVILKLWGRLPGRRPGLCRGGFTLLEMLMVLVILALILGGAIPAMQSAVNEHAIRDDSQQLAVMIKKAMLRSAEQHRSYVIELSPGSFSLHPEVMASAAEADPFATNPQQPADTDNTDTLDTISAPVDVIDTHTINSSNKVFLPDPDKPKNWLPLSGTTPTVWTFRPGELCPAPRIRVTRDDAYIEISFNALTGNVEDETLYIP